MKTMATRKDRRARVRAARKVTPAPVYRVTEDATPNPGFFARVAKKVRRVLGWER